MKERGAYMDNQFVIAMYLRISSSDEQYGDSQSITGQRNLINEHIQTHSEFKNANVIEFSDDGYSGTNFERPGIIKLLEKAKCGKINTVIVKDFSRFGRNYIDVGDYIEQIFPFLDIRFISINDYFDSSKHQNVGDIGVAFKHLCDDYYCKDISRKIKSGIKTAWESGKNISRGIYGYKKDPMNKYQLIIDENTAPIVRLIFDKAISGKSPSQIAIALNKEDILSPLQYLINNEKVISKKNLKRVWTKCGVLRIIRDLRYTGLLVQGMTACNGNSNIKIPQSEWFIHEGKFEAIVTKEEFENAQKCSKRRLKKDNVKTKSPHSFPVKIRCGGCGHTMIRCSGRSKKYYCRYTKFIEDNTCFTSKLGVDELRIVILTSIQQCYTLIENKKKNDDERRASSVETLKQIQFLERELSSISNSKLMLYNQYSDAKLSHEEYSIKQNEIDKNSEVLSEQINILKKDVIIAKEENLESAIEILEKFSYSTEYSDELVSALIDHIIVHDESCIEIEWKFKDFFNAKTVIPDLSDINSAKEI